MTWTSSVSFMCPSTLSKVNWMMAPAHKHPYSPIIIILLLPLLLLFHHSFFYFTPRLPTLPRPRWAEQKVAVVSAPLGLDGSGVCESAMEAAGAVSAQWVRPQRKNCDVGKMSLFGQKSSVFTVQEFFTSSGGYLTLDFGPLWFPPRLHSREVLSSNPALQGLALPLSGGLSPRSFVLIKVLMWRYNPT